MNGLRVLIVDDNRDLADGLADLLELEDHEVEVAYRGEDALERYREGRFDLTFLDVKLPGINGLEVFSEIRRIDPDARVVMMTGYRVDQLLQRAIDDGVLKVLRKPFAIEEVLAAIAEVRREGIVLVADDDPDFAEAVQQMLEEHGYQTLVANNGQKAVQMVMAGPVDVLVLDLRLPILDGLGVYLELKRLQRVVPTILVTGFLTEEEEKIDLLRSFSVTGCLLKPFEPQTLLGEIDQLLSVRVADGEV